MSTHTASHPNHWRVIGAIAAKDIGEAWRNRTLLGVALGLLATLFLAQALPFLLGLSGRQPVLLVAGPESALVEALASHDSLRVSRVNAAETAVSALVQQGGGALGIILPPEAEAELVAGRPVTLEAITPYATTEDQLAQATASFQAAVAELTGGGTVELTIRTVYPSTDSTGRPAMAVLSALLVLLLVGLLMIPNLMIEEKEDRTLEVLLVSPATPFDVAVGKALAGLAYGVIAMLVVGLFFHSSVVHWGVALLGCALAVLFGISLGLLLGLLFDNSSSLNLWTSGILLALILPVFMRLMPRLAAQVDSPMWQWIPSLAMARILTASMAAAIPVSETLWSAALVLAAIGLLIALVVAAVRRTTV